MWKRDGDSMCVATIKAKTEWQKKKTEKKTAHTYCLLHYIKRAKNLILVECDVIGRLHSYLIYKNYNELTVCRMAL